MIVTNTVSVESKLSSCSKIRSVDISPVLSEAVRRIHNGESMSYLFRNIPLEDWRKNIYFCAVCHSGQKKRTWKLDSAMCQSESYK